MRLRESRDRGRGRVLAGSRTVILGRCPNLLKSAGLASSAEYWNTTRRAAKRNREEVSYADFVFRTWLLAVAYARRFFFRFRFAGFRFFVAASA